MATNQGDSTSSTPYTGEDAQDALKRIMGTKKEDTTDYSTDSGENEDSVTQTPDDVLDTSIGVREGIIKSINPNATNGFYYKVYFEGTNTTIGTNDIHAYWGYFLSAIRYRYSIISTNINISVSVALAVHRTIGEHPNIRSPASLSFLLTLRLRIT